MARLFSSLILLAFLWPSSTSATDPCAGIKPPDPEEGIAALGGQVFRSPGTGKVIEVKLNGSARLRDEDLALVSSYTSLTDLSLEHTAITGAGLIHLRRLRKIEWLNLWQTTIGDEGLAHLSMLHSLQYLPVGGTRITDAGLEHLRDLPALLYLGLRDTDIGDAGVSKLTRLPVLKEINLRGTKVTDQCIESLCRIPTLRKVWLGETGISARGRARLKAGLPMCVIDLTGD